MFCKYRKTIFGVVFYRLQRLVVVIFLNSLPLKIGFCFYIKELMFISFSQ